jgi:hypothetical protein
MLRSFWRQHHPFKTDGYGDEAGERYAGFKEDVLALVSFLWKNGSTAQDQRNNRIGWSPPTWITQANFPLPISKPLCALRAPFLLGTTFHPIHELPTLLTATHTPLPKYIHNPLSTTAESADTILLHPVLYAIICAIAMSPMSRLQ